MRRALPILVACALLIGCTNSETEAANVSAVASETQSDATTTEEAPDADAVGFIDCVGSEAVVEPETVTTDCINNEDLVKWMAWRVWNDKRAVGWGRLNGKKVVKIELSRPLEAASGEKVFTQVSLNGTVLYR